MTPIAHGGEDIDENVQPLCRTCHKLKTREDFGVTKPPFWRTAEKETPSSMGK
ncbi:HNH endonuclease [Streptomyces xiamenensis]|uniref:HNH endonuclease n=1 Tax=Streptomyces xiamenensis TaxID=408015 RepID=UPI0035D9C18D